MSAGQDHPLHIVPIGWSMKAVREKFGDDIHPGDIFLHNDPYTGGTHLNDVAMIYPHVRGRPALRLPGGPRPLGRRGRHEPGQPLGRAPPRSSRRACASRPSRSRSAGRVNQAVLDVLFANMRGPRERRGRLPAPWSAPAGRPRSAIDGAGARATGSPPCRAAVAELIDRAEQRMRRAIRELPDGDVPLRGAPRSGPRAPRAAHGACRPR